MWWWLRCCCRRPEGEARLEMSMCVPTGLVWRWLCRRGLTLLTGAGDAGARGRRRIVAVHHRSAIRSGSVVVVVVVAVIIAIFIIVVVDHSHFRLERGQLLVDVVLGRWLEFLQLLHFWVIQIEGRQVDNGRAQLFVALLDTTTTAIGRRGP